jgi:quercetin dioxygenase-like cupin family protein
MKTSIIAALAVTCMFASAAWSQATTPAPQGNRYFTTPLENDPAREVYMQSITAPPGADNHFHRHPGDQWTAVQEGEVTFTIKGQPPVVLKAGEGNYVPRGTVHRQQTSPTSRCATSCWEYSTRASRFTRLRPNSVASTPAA